jgi:perosamine synthetase
MDEFLKAILDSTKGLLKWLIGKEVSLLPLGSTTVSRPEYVHVKRCINSAEDFFNQSEIDELHKKFCEYNTSDFAYSFINARSGLDAALRALELSPGDEVLVPGYTCIVVPNACWFLGLKVKFSDVELDSYGLDVDALESTISNETKVVIVQHLFGLVCRDYDRILKLCSHKGVKVIEDCSHALGATYKGRRIGNEGDMAFYSFEKSKVMSTYSGGVVSTNDAELGRKLREIYRQAEFPNKSYSKKLMHGFMHSYLLQNTFSKAFASPWLNWYYKDKVLETVSPDELESKRPNFYGCKLIAPLATVARMQLSRLDQINESRRKRSAVWREWCLRNGYSPPLVLEHSSPVLVRYPVLVEPDKKEDLLWMIKMGVQPGVWFTTRTHPVEINLEGCPNGIKAARQMVNFPT